MLSVENVSKSYRTRHGRREVLKGASFRLGFKSKGQFRGHAYDRTVEHRPDQHEVDNFRDLVSTIGVSRTASPAIRAVEAPLPEIAQGKDLIVFHPWPSGARSHLREWPEKNWLELAERLRQLKQPLGLLVTLEVGKIFAEGEGEVQEMIDICDFANGLSRQLYGLTIASERPNHRILENWHPLGLIGIISAFNFPVAV